MTAIEKPTCSSNNANSWYERCQAILDRLSPQSSTARFIGSIQASILVDPSRYPTSRQRHWIEVHAKTVGLPEVEIPVPEATVPPARPKKRYVPGEGQEDSPRPKKKWIPGEDAEQGPSRPRLRLYGTGTYQPGEGG